MKTAWITGPLLAFGLALAGGAQASSYVYVYGAAGSLTVNYDSRSGLSAVEIPGSNSVYAYSPGSAPTGLTAASISGGYYGPRYGASTFASSANLGDGTLHAYAGAGEVTVFVEAAMIDLLHFSVSGGGPASVTLNTHVDGSYASNGPYPGVGWNDIISIGGNRGPTGAYGYLYLGGNGADGGYLDSTHTDTRVNWDSFSSSNLSNTGHDFSGAFTVNDGDALSFYHRLQLQCTDAICDFSNTASVSFVLPDNVTLTSESGVFLTQTDAIPEPAAWALLIAGFGAVGTALRRRRAQPALA